MPILHSFEESKLEYKDEDDTEIKMMGTRMNEESLKHNLYVQKSSSVHKDRDLNTTKLLETVFHFPEGIVIHKDTPFSLPLWFRAATLGNVSLYLIVYYEIENKLTIMRYRTLRIHHMLEVLQSLDVSFNISLCPTRLKEYIMRMDVINRTSLRSIKLHQLSSVGDGWKISLIESMKGIFPSGNLGASPALSCFLKLKS
ncbi:trafficking protein particle complex subunit 8 isoform X1 [Tanacetum coccineum]